MRAVFRADGSSQIGLGHIMRCLSLAEELKSNGHQVHFLSREDKVTDRLINESEMKIHTLSGTSPFPQAELDEEIKVVKEHLEKIGPDVVITDSYDLTTRYLEIMKSCCKVLVSIDDLAEIELCSDIVVNPNLMGEDMIYKNKISGIQLLGPRYFCLRSEFRDLLRAKEKPSKNSVRFLISMGGSDMLNLTPKILKSLTGVKRDFECDVIIGPSFNNIQEINSLLKEFPNLFDIHQNPKSMAQLMLGADFAICSGGGTVYELLFMGIPTIVLCQTKNQYENAKVLDSYGAIKNFGYGKDNSITKITNEIEDLMEDYKKLQQMKSRGKELIDGQGTKRVMEAILERGRDPKYEELTLRSVKEEDCLMLWEWRNDPITRRNSINKERIPFDTHKNWFCSSLKAENRKILIGVVGDRSIGEVRFDIDPKTHSAEVDVSVAPERRGKGYGSTILKKASDYGIKNLGIRTLIARVNKDNIVSLKVFQNAGFKVEKTGELITLKFVSDGE